MKPYRLLFIVLLLLSAPAYLPAQTAFGDQVKALHEALRKTPGYKNQIKGEAQKNYMQIVNKLEKQTPADDRQRFSLLAELVTPLRDNHLYFYEKPAQEIAFAQFRDSAFSAAYRLSPAFTTFPRVQLNLDSLEQVLSRTDSNQVAGVYYYETYMKVGVFESGAKGEYTGVVLMSQLPNWDKGQVFFAMKENGAGLFAAISYQVVQKTMGFIRHIRFVQQSLPLLYIKKYPARIDYSIVKAGTPLFELKYLANDIQYLRAGSFASTPANIAHIKQFLAQINDSVKAPYLVVDIRNNGGGGNKASNPFRRLLKKYAQRGKIYLLMNYHTVSNAEAFALDMRDAGVATLAGETTRGMITYGSNTDKVVQLPDSRFKLYITDMRGSARDLKYEDTGVSPVISLEPDSDWLQQIEKIIRQH